MKTINHPPANRIKLTLIVFAFLSLFQSSAYANSVIFHCYFAGNTNNQPTTYTIDIKTGSVISSSEVRNSNIVKNGHYLFTGYVDGVHEKSIIFSMDYKDQGIRRLSLSIDTGIMILLDKNGNHSSLWFKCNQDLSSTQNPSSQSESNKQPIATTGSGLILNQNGSIITNYHVVKNCGKIYIAHFGKKYPGNIAALNYRDDLAVISTTLRQSKYASFKRTGSELGEDIVVAGFPLHGVLRDLNITTGIISSVSGPNGDTRHWQFTAPIQQGNSGGPLIDKTGLITGLVVSKLDSLSIAKATGDIPQNINFAIKSEVAIDFLKLESIPFKEAESRKRMTTAQIATLAKDFTVRVECLN